VSLEKDAAEYFYQFNGLTRVGTIDIIDFLRNLPLEFKSQYEVVPFDDITLVLGGDTFSDLLHLKWKQSER
jgi:hypothetical protein